EAADGGVPGQDGEGVQVGQGGELGGRGAATGEGAVTGALEVGHHRAVHLHALPAVAHQLVGGYDLAEDAAGHGDALVVDVLDAGLGDALAQRLQGRLVRVALTVLVECGRGAGEGGRHGKPRVSLFRRRRPGRRTPRAARVGGQGEG